MATVPKDLGRQVSLQYLLELQVSLDEAYTRHGSWWEYMQDIFLEHSHSRDLIIRELKLLNHA